MKCPQCGCVKRRVVDSRPLSDTIRRRAECTKCKMRYTTYEVFADESDQEMSPALREAYTDDDTTQPDWQWQNYDDDGIAIALPDGRRRVYA